jgi:tetratricopeptide (TPR) repeat protein
MRVFGAVMKKRFPNLSPVFAILWLIAAIQSADAVVSDVTISKKLSSANVLPKNTSHRLVRNGRDLRLEVFHYPTLDARTQKIDALLLARTILHADPGGIDSLITRFFVDSEPGTYRDVLVSNRDIVGADAGIVSTDQLLNGIEVVTIRSGDGAEQRFSGYWQAGNQALRKEDFRESENLFALAFKEGPEVARKDGRYYAGLVQLAHGYSGREDSDDERRVYSSIMSSLPLESSAESLRALRDVYGYYLKANDLSNALRAAGTLVELHVRAGNTKSEEYASDLQLIAECHRRQGQADLARKEFEEALNVKMAVLGDHHGGLAEIYEGLGDCYSDEKNSAKAQEYWHKAKVAYDHAAVTKDAKHHISYEVYRAIIGRLNAKLGPKVKPRWSFDNK